MRIKGLLFLVLFLSVVSLCFPKNSQAFSLGEALTSEDSIITKIQEGIEYFIAFKDENKVRVLEKQAEKRLTYAQGYADEGNEQKVQSLVQNYLQIKEKQNELLGKIDDGEVLGAVEERTIEQQRTMEQIKLKIDNDGKQNVIQVQERVVNQVAKRVIDVNGTEGTTEFLNEVAHVWAPGTGPGGEAGVVYAGGGKLIYAPGTGPGGQSGVVIEGGEMKFASGTSEGGSSTADIKNVEVKTGGTSNNEAPANNSGLNLAPDTTQGGSGGNTIDPGGVDSGNTSDSQTWIAP